MPSESHGMLATSLSVTPCKLQILCMPEVHIVYNRPVVALMSRPIAGVRHQTLILTLPGSPKGAKENLESVIKLLPHACQQAAGADSRAMHVGGVKKLEKEAGVESPRAASST